MHVAATLVYEMGNINIVERFTHVTLDQMAKFITSSTARKVHMMIKTCV